MAVITKKIEKRVSQYRAEDIARLGEKERLELIKSLSVKEKAALYYNWEFWARDKQLPPQGDWFIWLLLAGRGAGKTRSLNELVRKWAKQGYSPIGLIGQTKGDVRDTLVEVGESSILKISPPWFMPEYEPSKRRLTWPNGVQAIIYSGDEPDQIRGANLQKAAVDELFKFHYPQETWDMLMMAVRSGDNPQTVVASTPRPCQLIKSLLIDKRVVVTRGHTLENQANLAPEFLSYIMSKYQGTKLGRQELAGEVLSSMEGLVYDAFKADMCVIPRFAIPDNWPRYFGMDFGRVNTAALWYAMEPETGFLYLYRTYKAKATQVEHAVKLRELSRGENIKRSVGGNLQEENTREGYRTAGWKIYEPKFSNDRKERIERVNSLHAQNKIYVFSDLNEYLDEKLSFSYEVDKDDNLTDKIHNEAAFHYMSAEGYILSEFEPDVVRDKNAQVIWIY